MQWFRWYHGTCSDPKLGSIARKAGQTRERVIATWAMILEAASDADERGTFATDADAIADVLNCETDAIQAIIDEMSARHMLGEGIVTKWEERQPARDSSAQRMRQKRQRDADVTRTECHSDATVTPPDTDTDTDTDIPSVLPSEIHPPEGGTSKPATKRSTRLTAEWQPDATDIAYSHSLGMSNADISRCRDDIVDWSLGSKNGAKRDWHAAWRTWCRRFVAERDNGPRRSAGDRPKPGGVVAAARRQLDRVGRQHGGAGDPVADVWGTGEGSAGGGVSRRLGSDATGDGRATGEGAGDAAVSDESGGDGGRRHGFVERGFDAGVATVSGGRGIVGDPPSGAGIHVLSVAGGTDGSLSPAVRVTDAVASPADTDADLTLPEFLRATR